MTVTPADTLTFITPQDEAQAEQYFQQFIALLLPINIPMEDCWEWVICRLPSLTLVFMGNVLVGAIELELYKKSAEVHGTYHTNFDQKTSPPIRRKIKHLIHKTIFDRAFTNGREKVISKLPADNKRGRAFLTAWGFKRLMANGKPVMDEGREVWKLTKEDYLAHAS